MKTKEEILEELFYKPETQDWYKPVLKAMETYAQQLRQPPGSGECEHPYHAVLGDGEMQPAKCLKCGKVL